MIAARMQACSNAVGSGDAAVATQAAAEIDNMWTQAQAALQKYETAMGARAAGQVRLMPRPQEMARPQELGGGGSTGLPEGWGNRQTMMSEAELVQKGIIAPPDPLSSS